MTFSVTSRVFVAGHRGMVGAAVVRRLREEGCANLLLAARSDLDLTSQADVNRWFSANRPDVVVFAAAKVGGIHANKTYPAEFLYQNLAMVSHAVHAAWQTGTQQFLFLGSTCIYPRLAPQPISECSLLTSPLEPTNEAYAIAKIAGLKLCQFYRRQYGVLYHSAMPTNLYGPGDNYHLENSHVIPALIRKFHEAKMNNQPNVMVWGTGTPKREFLYSDDMAQACVHVLNLAENVFKSLTAADRNDGLPPLLNLGSNSDLSIAELASLVQEVVGYVGDVVFDTTKPDGTMRKLMDSARLNQLGWHVKTAFKDGLMVAYQHFQEHNSQANQTQTTNTQATNIQTTDTQASAS